MGDTGDNFREFREASKNHRNRKQAKVTDLLRAWCTINGVTMTVIQDWHIRLTKDTKTLDIHPQRNKWHDVVTTKRGEYKRVTDLLEKHFN